MIIAAMVKFLSVNGMISIVDIASNHFTHEPVHRIKRRVRGQVPLK